MNHTDRAIAMINAAQPYINPYIANCVVAPCGTNASWNHGYILVRAGTWQWHGEVEKCPRHIHNAVAELFARAQPHVRRVHWGDENTER